MKQEDFIKGIEIALSKPTDKWVGDDWTHAVMAVGTWKRRKKKKWDRDKREKLLQEEEDYERDSEFEHQQNEISWLRSQQL